MKSREEDRARREKEILTSLKGQANEASLLSLDKHLAKFVRKMLMLTVSDSNEVKKNQCAFLLQRFPVYMHLSQIMEERTETEKEAFGKVTFQEVTKDFET
jgi:hypothetical protein